MLGYDLPLGYGKRGNESLEHESVNFKGGSFDFTFVLLHASSELDTMSPEVATISLVSIFFESDLGFGLQTNVVVTFSTLALL